MEHSDGKSIASRPVELPGQVVPLFTFGIALSVNGRCFFSVNEQGDPFDGLCRKDMDVGREGNLRLPGLEGVVIAQDGKDLNLVLGQFMQQPYVVELCRKVVIGAGIDVACDEDGVNLFIDGQLYDF